MSSRADWVAHLTYYPMRELRRRQEILQQQLNISLKAKNENPEILARMNTMLDSLTEAVMIKNGQ